MLITCQRVTDYNLAAGPTEVISLYNNLYFQSVLLIQKILHDYSRCQEVCIVLSSDLAREVLCSKVVFISLCRFRGELVGLFPQQPLGICLVNFLAFGCRNGVFAPLPQLASANLCSCGILLTVQTSVSSVSRLIYHSYHKVVDRDTSDPSQPSFHVSKTNVQVLADTLFSDGTGHVHI